MNSINEVNFGLFAGQGAIREHLMRLAHDKGRLLDARHIITAYALAATANPNEAAGIIGVTPRTITNRVEQLLERTGLNDNLNSSIELRGYLRGLLAVTEEQWV